jgi:hypothetical protein
MTMRWLAASCVSTILGISTFTPALALPTGWKQHSVGSGGPTGNATESGGTFTITSTGAGAIWGTADKFYFVHQTYAGDFEFVAKLNITTSGDDQAGIMIREDSDPNAPGAGSRNVFLHQGSKCDPCYGFFAGEIVRSTGRNWTSERTIWGNMGVIPTYLESTTCPDPATCPTNCTCANPIPYQYLKIIRLKDQITLYTSADISNNSNWRHVEGWTLDALAPSVEIGFAVTNGGATQSTVTFGSVSLKPLVLPYQTSWFGNSFPGGTAHVLQTVLSMHVNSSNNRIYLSDFWDEATDEGSIIKSDGKYYARFSEIHGLHSGYAITTDSSYAYIGVRVPGVDPTNPNGGCDGDSGRPNKPNVRYGIRRYDLNGQPAPLETCNAYCNCTNGYDGSIRSMVEVPNGTCSNSPTTVCLADSDCGLGNHCSIVDRHIRGLASAGGVLYVSDTQANAIRMFDTTANLASLGDFPASPAVTAPRALAVASDGSLWIVGGVGALRKVFHYAATGIISSEELYDDADWNPVGIAIDSSGVIWVTDTGPDQNIKKFNANGTSAGTFGDIGGTGSGTKGAVSPLKFNIPVGVGFDSGGNIYVASDGGYGTGIEGGTELRKFNSSGSLLWERDAVEFSQNGDADPSTNAKDIYTTEAHYSMDYSQSAGSEWTYKANTFDWPSGYDDVRQHLANNGESGGAYLRRGSDGKRYLFVTTTHGTYFGAFRFETNTSETAIPAALFADQHVFASSINQEIPAWPLNQPQGTGNDKPWLWVDGVGTPDGLVASTEYEVGGVNETVRNWWVDSQMDVWAAIILNPNAAIRRYRFQGFYQGVPRWSLSPSATFTHPLSDLNSWTNSNCTTQQKADLAVTEVRRLLFDPATKDMYVTVFTHENNDCDINLNPGPDDPCAPKNDILNEHQKHDFQAGGRELRRYSNWDGTGTGTVRQLRWRALLPWGGVLRPGYGFYHNATSIAFAGSRAYANVMDTGEIQVYDTEMTANPCVTLKTPLKILVPGPEIAGKTGWFDNPTSMNAFKRSNGDYLVIAEEDLMAKGVLYRDAGAPLYQETFTGGTNPFTLTNPVSGGSTSLATILGSQVVEFLDTSSGLNGAIFQNTLNSSTPLVSRINQVYALPTGSTPVAFEMNFTLERAAASTNPITSIINVGVLLNKVGGGVLNPTGLPVIYGSPAYNHDEAAGSEILEMVDRNWNANFRFTITPNSGATVISTLNFQFMVKVGGGATPESYYVDNLTAFEVLP